MKAKYLITLFVALTLTTGGKIHEEPQLRRIIVPQQQPQVQSVETDQDKVMPPQPEKEKVIARVTAYAPFDNRSGMCNDGNPNVTSRGYRPSRAYAAVDPEKIAYDTKLNIPGYGEVIAGDTGGALRSYEGIAIDVFMDTYEEAIAWGVQYLEIEIMEGE